MSSSASRIEYSEKYADDGNEYRYVNLTFYRQWCCAPLRIVVFLLFCFPYSTFCTNFYVHRLSENTSITPTVMLFFLRSSPRPFLKAVCWPRQSGVALAFNKVVDGNTTQFTGEWDLKWFFDIYTRDFFCSHGFFSLLQSWAPHSPFPSSAGNRSTKRTSWPRVAAKGPWRIPFSVRNSQLSRWISGEGCDSGPWFVISSIG